MGKDWRSARTNATCYFQQQLRLRWRTICSCNCNFRRQFLACTCDHERPIPERRPGTPCVKNSGIVGVLCVVGWFWCPCHPCPSRCGGTHQHLNAEPHHKNSLEHSRITASSGFGMPERTMDGRCVSRHAYCTLCGLEAESTRSEGPSGGCMLLSEIR